MNIWIFCYEFGILYVVQSAYSGQARKWVSGIVFLTVDFRGVAGCSMCNIPALMFICFYLC